MGETGRETWLASDLAEYGVVVAKGCYCSWRAALAVRDVHWETLALYVKYHVHVVGGASVVLSPWAMIASGDKCLNVLILASSGADVCLVVLSPRLAGKCLIITAG